MFYLCLSFKTVFKFYGVLMFMYFSVVIIWLISFLKDFFFFFPLDFAFFTAFGIVIAIVNVVHQQFSPTIGNDSIKLKWMML